MFQFLKNQIKTSHTFWRFRHLVDPCVWQSYHADHAAKRRRFYAVFMRHKKLRSVFEFGCASGPNLQSIINHMDSETADEPLIVVGHDINRKALEVARSHMASNTQLFVDTLEASELVAFLAQHNTAGFGLAIYDRVLYLLDTAAVEEHFRTFAFILNNVVIDDFHHVGAPRTNGAYFTKDYAAILKAHGFELDADEKSEHPSNEAFFRENARRLILRKRR